MTGIMFGLILIAGSLLYAGNQVAEQLKSISEQGKIAAALAGIETQLAQILQEMRREDPAS